MALLVNATDAETTRCGNERGAVYVEFLIAFFPVFVLVLGICQLAFIASAKAVVEHASWAAARSAVVVLDDEPKRYGGIPRRNHVLISSKHIAGIDDVMKTLNIDTGSTNAVAKKAGGTIQDQRRSSELPADRSSEVVAKHRRWLKKFPSRMTPIRAAAYLPLLPLANTDWANANSSVRFAIHDQFFFRMQAALQYTKAAAAVTLHDGPSDESVKFTEFQPNSLVTVRVVYLFSCDVPIARQLICRSLESILSSTDQKNLAALDEAEDSDLRASVLPANGRYTVLRGASTLLLQSAGYEKVED